MLDVLFILAAVVGGTVMVFQFALTVLGLSDHGDGVGDLGDVDAGDGFDGDVGVLDGDVPGDHHTSVSTAADGQLHPDSSWLFGVVTFRTLVAALAFFGLAGMAALRMNWSPPVAVILALVGGFAAMYGMYWSMQSVARLATSGNERIGNAVGRRATVYIPIPADSAGVGKVQLSMQNRIVEFQAMTDGGERLPTGSQVEVVGVAGSDTLNVRRVEEAAHA
jgi:membrane protein implicated in regulation of membrane protease activity